MSCLVGPHCGYCKAEREALLRQPINPNSKPLYTQEYPTMNQTIITPAVPAVVITHRFNVGDTVSDKRWRWESEVTSVEMVEGVPCYGFNGLDARLADAVSYYDDKGHFDLKPKPPAFRYTIVIEQPTAEYGLLDVTVPQAIRKIVKDFTALKLTATVTYERDGVFAHRDNIS